MTMSPIRNVDLLKIALLFVALFAVLLTMHTGACSDSVAAAPCRGLLVAQRHPCCAVRSVHMWFACCYLALLSGRSHTVGAPGGRNHLSATTALRVVTWNVAAINNNPFEYWITHDEDPSYDSMMQAVRRFVEEDVVRSNV